jgi:hypothetical protein
VRRRSSGGMSIDDFANAMTSIGVALLVDEARARR